MKKSFSAVLAAVAAAALLTACGGGGDSDVVFEDEEPESSGRNGSVVLASSDRAGFDGTYANTDVRLNEVEKFNPVGSDPELCRYRFDRLVKPADTRFVKGDIRYQPGTPTVRVMFITVYRDQDVTGVEYSLDEPTGATVNRTTNQVNFAGARFTSTNTAGARDTITLTGNIPMLDNRPEGC